MSEINESKMKAIFMDTAVKTLMNARPGLYADFVSMVSSPGVKEKSKAFDLDYALTIKTLWYGTDNFVWYICDKGDSDICIATSCKPVPNN